MTSVDMAYRLSMWTAELAERLDAQRTGRRVVRGNDGVRVGIEPYGVRKEAHARRVTELMRLIKREYDELGTLLGDAK